MATDYFSDLTRDYLAKTQKAESSMPGAYQSRWQATLDQMLSKILNREDFKYDFNADPLYQHYKDQYVNAGRNAMMDTVGQVSALTGGYGNSFAATAGSQAYQEYLKGLTNKIPELYNAAMSKYKMDTDNMYRQYDAVGAQEDREYAQYEGNWNRAYNMMGYFADQYNSGAGRDQSDYQFAEEMAFKRERAAQEDAHWAAEMALRQGSLNDKNAGSATGSAGGSSRRSSSSRKSSGSSGDFIKTSFTPNSGYEAVLYNALQKGSTKEANAYLKDMYNSGSISKTEYNNLKYSKDQDDPKKRTGLNLYATK